MERGDLSYWPLKCQPNISSVLAGHMEDTVSKNLTEGALERNLYKPTNLYKVFRIDQNTSKLRVSLVLVRLYRKRFDRHLLLPSDKLCN